jgi:hypothetical protein
MTTEEVVYTAMGGGEFRGIRAPREPGSTDYKKSLDEDE